MSAGRKIVSMTLRRRRNSLRHPIHDYRADGSYLLTFVVSRRRWLLGEIREAEMLPSLLGLCVLEQVLRIHHWSPVATVDTCALMPNHVHLILTLHGSLRCAENSLPGAARDSVSAVVGQVKSRATAAAIRRGIWLRGERLWQRSFHDRRLPDLRAIKAARRYLQLNPARWEERYGPGLGTGRPCGSPVRSVHHDLPGGSEKS